MTNNILRLETDPDTGKEIEVYMSDEEWVEAFHPTKPNKQLLRNKINEMKISKTIDQNDQDARIQSLGKRITELENIVNEMRKQK